MAMIRAVLHACAGVLHDPAAVLHHLNRHFEFLWDTAMFATAVYGVLDVERARDDRSRRASAAAALGPGRPVGTVVPERRGCCCSATWGPRAEDQLLAAGDRLVLYTDGLTDRQGPDGQLYDLERLSATLGRHAEQRRALLERLVADVEAFTGGREAEDDQTLLVVRPSEKALALDFGARLSGVGRSGPRPWRACG